MDEVLLGKAAIIERCLKRIEQEYRGHEGEFESNDTRQDSILLNLQRACEAAIDAAMHLVRIHRLGIPGESKQAFMLLTHAGRLDPNLAAHLAAMVGFRNIAVHNYRELDMNAIRSVLDTRLVDLKAFAADLVSTGITQNS